MYLTKGIYDLEEPIVDIKDVITFISKGPYLG
jgi:hypothetical protein